MVIKKAMKSLDLHQNGQKLINFLEELKKLKGKIARVTCNYVVNTENIVDISKIGELCKEYNLEELD